MAIVTSTKSTFRKEVKLKRESERTLRTTKESYSEIESKVKVIGERAKIEMKQVSFETRVMRHHWNTKDECSTK